MNKADLLKLIQEDEHGLLDHVKKTASPTSQDRLIESFLEINSFFKIHNRKPESCSSISEHKLASRLKHLKEDHEAVEKLSKYDTYSLLSKTEEITELDQLFNSDEFNLLEIEDDSILSIKNIPRMDCRKATDFIARRTPCKDFSKFESLFIDIQESFKKGTSKLKTFEHGDVQAGSFFVLNGVLLYVKSVNLENKKDRYGKKDGRLRCIFENGTESNMKYRSLQKSLEISGKTVVSNIQIGQNISKGDIESGYIYILKSLSTDPEISSINNLFKIGYSTTTVEKRIENADQDPTYLMAPVSIVSSYKCFNMNTQRFERLLHRFFDRVRLNIDITDKKFNRYTPKEWFIAPIDVIDKVIQLIISGEIVNYRFNEETNSIDKK